MQYSSRTLLLTTLLVAVVLASVTTSVHDTVRFGKKATHGKLVTITVCGQDALEVNLFPPNRISFRSR